MVKRLTDRQLWDSKYQYVVTSYYEGPFSAMSGSGLKRIVPPVVVAFMQNYADFLLWEKIYPMFLSPDNRWRVLEIGSAPGHHLVRLHKRFGYKPFGVDYSLVGVEKNRELFAANGIDPANIVYGDFFSDSFRSSCRECFDLVVSRGFIEHFSDPYPVVDAHVDCARPGGLVCVSIPNFTGLNGFLVRAYNRPILKTHNFESMRLSAFQSFFDENRLEKLFLGYYGTINLNIVCRSSGAIDEGLKNLQIILNILCRLLFRDRGMETPFISPYLLYIGRRR